MSGSYYEFFAGAGMARAGLGPHWRCLFANDFDQKKAATYRLNWSADEFVCEDVRKLATENLPGQPDLVWASFPCQDLSLAGGGAGLKGERSGTFWPFWHLMVALRREGRAPALIVIENVCGTLTSHGGKDFAALCTALRTGGYRFGAVVVDAVHFVPQSRPRLFVIAVPEGSSVPRELLGKSAEGVFHPRALRAAFGRLEPALQERWIWWHLPTPSPRNVSLADAIDDEPSGVPWHTPAETQRLLDLMSDVHLAKVENAMRERCRVVGTVYKRTRRDDAGRRVQRAEVRFDEVAGCLRTPAGGSSRQLIMVVEDGHIRSRLISSRETARLMGLPEEYVLPDNYNEAYHLTGDGVVVPVVRFLAEHVIEKVLPPRLISREAA